MPYRFEPRKKDQLLSEEREERLQPKALLHNLGLRPGQTIADIGAGPGFFTLPAAEIVGPEGLVLAAEIQGEMLSAVRSRAAEHGYKNVRVVKTSEDSVPLPAGSCDMILLAFTLHEIQSHATFLHRLARLLKPEGRLAVIEWEKQPTTDGPPVEDRIGPDQLLADAEAAGLHLDERRNLNDEQYLCVFSRTAESQ